MRRKKLKFDILGDVISWRASRLELATPLTRAACLLLLFVTAWSILAGLVQVPGPGYRGWASPSTINWVVLVAAPITVMRSVQAGTTWHSRLTRRPFVVLVVRWLSLSIGMVVIRCGLDWVSFTVSRISEGGRSAPISPDLPSSHVTSALVLGAWSLAIVVLPLTTLWIYLVWLCVVLAATATGIVPFACTFMSSSADQTRAAECSGTLAAILAAAGGLSFALALASRASSHKRLCG